MVYKLGLTIVGSWTIIVSWISGYNSLTFIYLFVLFIKDMIIVYWSLVSNSCRQASKINRVISKYFSEKYSTLL